METGTIENNKIEIDYNGKVYRYEYNSLTSLQAETANEIMSWYNDAKKRLSEAQLKELHRSDMHEVKDALVAHLVREVTANKQMLPYEPIAARESVKKFMSELPFGKFSAVKDEIITNFFLTQGRLHLATKILRKEQKKPLNAETLQLLMQLMPLMNSTVSQGEKNAVLTPSTVENLKKG
jgi:hypothetical protein